MDTAMRRHHKERIKRKVWNHYYSYWLRDPFHRPSWADEAYVKEWLGKQATTRTRCSCYMCGNPRRMFGLLTRQELGAKLDEQEALEQIA